MTPEQCTVGRELLGWTIQELAVKSGVGTAPVLMLEVGHAILRPETLTKLQTTLEAGGVDFSGPEVQLREVSKACPA